MVQMTILEQCLLGGEPLRCGSYDEYTAVSNDCQISSSLGEELNGSLKVIS